jgi:uncharacterized protein YjbJ (UPF0337 family)
MRTIGAEQCIVFILETAPSVSLVQDSGRFRRIIRSGFPQLGFRLMGCAHATGTIIGSKCLLLVTSIHVSPQERIMDKNRIKGSATRTGGKIKQAAGDLTGDSKLQSEGKMDQAKGKIQNAVGSVKDALKK